MFDFRKNHILQALLILAIAWLVLKLKSIIVLFFIAFLFVLVLRPVVLRLKAWHFPTLFAVLTPILGAVGIIVMVGFFLVPSLAGQVQQFAAQTPNYLTDLQHTPLLHGSKIKINIKSVSGFLQAHSSQLSSAILSLTTTAIAIVVGIVTIIVVTLYGVGSYEGLRQTFLSYVPSAHRGRAHDILMRIEKKIVSWVAAQVLLSVAVGLLVWVGAMILGLPFPGILGLISGTLEIVPTLGPIVAAVPGILLGLTISLRMAIYAALLYIIVQQIENHILAPWLLGRTVNLHPIVIIFSLLVGALFYGILGALLAVPSALVVSSFVDSFRADAHPPDDKPSLTHPRRRADRVLHWYDSLRSRFGRRTAD